MSPDTYIPILRNKGNERQVVQSFGGFSNFSKEEYPVSLQPLVEIGGEDEIDRLRVFRDAGEQVLVELPVYQTTRSTDFGEQIQQNIEKFGDQVGFYLANVNSSLVPVVSQEITRSGKYNGHSEQHRELQHQYPSIAHRLMVRGKRLSNGQKEALRELANVLRPDDRVLFDVVDSGFNDAIEDNLEFLAEEFNQQGRAVLNVLNAFGDNPENLSPRIANELGIAGFGDFGINVRYPGGWGGGDAKIRHYHPGKQFVKVFEEADYEQAASELTSWDEWRTNHCNYCRTATGLKGGSASDWKRVRTGHYITSMLRGEF